MNRIDPLGLWQITTTITLDPFLVGPGGTLTFGYNHGQFNLGGWLGASAGDPASLNLNDMPCHDAGVFESTRADGKLSLLNGAFSTNFSAQYGSRVKSTEFTSGVPFIKSLETGVSVDDGIVTPMPIVNIVAGESVSIGVGAQVYW